MNCPRDLEKEMNKMRPRRSIALAALCGVIALFVATAAVAAAGPITFTTIPPPSGDYDLVGIISSFTQFHSVPSDGPKQFQEAMKNVYPDLSDQAQTKGADMVVVTHIQILESKGDSWLLVYGTAIRTRGSKQVVVAGAGGGNAGATPSTEPPTAEKAGEAAQEIAGSWAGTIIEVGAMKPIGITVNIKRGASPGEYTGSIALEKPECEITMESIRSEGGTFYFKGVNATKLRCRFFGGFSATPKPGGKLEWRVFERATFETLKFEGVIERK